MNQVSEVLRQPRGAVRVRLEQLQVCGNLDEVL
jgi:hypothetical protein